VGDEQSNVSLAILCAALYYASQLLCELHRDWARQETVQSMADDSRSTCRKLIWDNKTQKLMKIKTPPTK
jgi:hypothetical protein